MRPRFRSARGPNAPRDGRPLELVRVRGPQRDPGPEGRRVERGGRPRRRRGGRGPRPPAPAPARFSLLGWLKGLFGGGKPAPAPRGRAGRPDLSDQEARALTEFGRAYDITFRDPGLLKLALTHRSYLHVTGQGPRESNERLEFLGDSVLGLVTSEFLYRSHPGEHEGQLTKTKSLLVSKAILSRRALAMGLGRFVLMSHAEVESGGRQRLSILADAFESVIGAIYLDQGFEAARGFIDRWLLRESKVIAADRRHTNYKSHLQEYVQSTFRTHPVYRIRHEMGPDHSKQFMVEVMVGRRVLGEGRGRNKKEAEQAAARNALEAVESGPVSDREKRRVERHVPREGAPESGRAAPLATPIEPDAGEEEVEVERGDESGRRRRRGRRGGRGRREREPGTTASSETSEARRSPAPTAPDRPEPRRPAASSSMTPVRSELPRVPAPPPAPRAIEIEPRPPAREEDENEEVGRPEGPPGELPREPYREPYRGPREERRVDPYAWESRPEPFEPERTQAPSEPSEEAPADREPEVMTRPDVEPESEPEPAEEPWVPAPPAEAEGGEQSADEEEGPRYPEVEPPPPPPAAPTWGRRNRRGR
jgi:ribonuclease-3